MFRRVLPVVAFLAALLVPAAEAQQKKLVIGTKVVPPFVMKEVDGDFTGLSIELWQRLAAELRLEYELREMTLPDMLAALDKKEIDAAIAAITVTGDREQAFDFTHAYFTTGLGIGVAQTGSAGWLGVVRRFVSWNFLKVISTLAFLLFVVGGLVWLVERKRNEAQFGGTTVQGLGHAFWWSAVTMTTVGYGDKAPVTFAGRMIGLVWMFAAVIITSTFTAAITSALTVSQLESRIRGPHDLPGVHVGVVKGTTGETYARRERLSYTAFDDAEHGVDALADGRIDAMVYDAAVMSWVMREKGMTRLTVLPQTFDQQDYAIGLPDGSALREPINRALVKLIRSEEWQERARTYTGG